jgi:hypothetical protein
MTEYKEAFKLDTQDVDASVAAGPEYRTMLAQLQADDLPRFVARFKELLNENTIREVAHCGGRLASGPAPPGLTRSLRAAERVQSGSPMDLLQGPAWPCP